MHVEVDVKCNKLILVDVASSILEILLHLFTFKLAKFPFHTINISPWDQKIELVWKSFKFYQINIPSNYGLGPRN